MKKTRISAAEVFTVPNILSFFRLALIPIFCILYLNGKFLLTAVVLLASGITDIVDGFIARRCNMISDFGKILDPIADKLTQLAMLFCLLFRFPHMTLPFIVLAVKELFSGICGLIAVRKSDEVPSAVWHGKLCTVLLYSMMLLHLIWYDIPLQISYTTVAVCIICMLLSLVLYSIRNIRVIRDNAK